MDDYKKERDIRHDTSADYQVAPKLVTSTHFKNQAPFFTNVGYLRGI